MIFVFIIYSLTLTTVTYFDFVKWCSENIATKHQASNKSVTNCCTDRSCGVERSTASQEMHIISTSVNITPLKLHLCRCSPKLNISCMIYRQIESEVNLPQLVFKIVIMILILWKFTRQSEMSVKKDILNLLWLCINKEFVLTATLWLDRENRFTIIHVIGAYYTENALLNRLDYGMGKSSNRVKS